MNPLVPIFLALTNPQDAPEPPTQDAPTLEVTLQDALRLGTAYSLALQASEAIEDSARYERDSRWARFDWKLRVEGSLTDAQHEGSSELSGAPILDQQDQGLTLSLTRPTATGPTFEVIYSSAETTTNNTYAYLPHSTTGTLTLGMTQSLLAGRGRDYVTANQFQGDNDFAFQSESVRAVRRALVEQIFQAYWSLVSAQGAMESADLGVQYAEEFLKLSQDRYNAGVGLELDILQAQTEVAVRTQTRTQLQIGRMNAEDTLRQFLYTTNNPRAWSEVLLAVDELPRLDSRPELPSWEESYHDVRRISPEIRQQELKLSSANRLLHVAESDEQSRLDFQLRVSTRGFEKSAFEAWEESIAGEYPTLTAAIRWDLPLSGAEPRARARKTRADVRNAQLELDSAERKLTSSLRMVIRALDLQYFAFKSAESSQELATRQHKIEIARYREGRSTAMRVLAAQQVLLEANASMLEAQATFVIARGQLEVLLGQHDH